MSYNSLDVINIFLFIILIVLIINKINNFENFNVLCAGTCTNKHECSQGFICDTVKKSCCKTL